MTSPDKPLSMADQEDVWKLVIAATRFSIFALFGQAASGAGAFLGHQHWC